MTKVPPRPVSPKGSRYHTRLDRAAPPLADMMRRDRVTFADLPCLPCVMPVPLLAGGGIARAGPWHETSSAAMPALARLAHRRCFCSADDRISLTCLKATAKTLGEGEEDHRTELLTTMNFRCEVPMATVHTPAAIDKLHAETQVDNGLKCVSVREEYVNAFRADYHRNAIAQGEPDMKTAKFAGAAAMALIFGLATAYAQSATTPGYNVGTGSSAAGTTGANTPGYSVGTGSSATSGTTAPGYSVGTGSSATSGTTAPGYSVGTGSSASNGTTGANAPGYSVGTGSAPASGSK